MTLRAWGRLVAAFLLLAFCVAGFAVARIAGREVVWFARFLRLLGRLLGLRVRIEGRPRGGHVLFAANHISWLDIIALGGATGTRFVAKAQIARWPLVGVLARLGGTVFVSRERRGATRAQADAVAAALREARPVTLFAEGGTGDGSVVRPFRPALFASAVEAGVPVQPVAIDYGPGRTAYAWPAGDGFAQEARRMLARTAPVPVTLRFLDPIGGAAGDRKMLAAEAQAAVAAALARADQMPAYQA